jgi:nucleotidyltransferase substrate binding protein (TIGR01987 family)
MTIKDIRWIQRLSNFNKAFTQLGEAVLLAERRRLSTLEEQGLIQAFEFTHELAWNVLKDFLEDRGVDNLFGSKDATREAFRTGLIEHGDIWMDMIRSRNLTTHTYDEATAAEIGSAVIHSYFAEFERFRTRMTQLKEDSV